MEKHTCKKSNIFSHDCSSSSEDTFNRQMEKMREPKPIDGNALVPKFVQTLNDCISCTKECIDYVKGSHNATKAIESGISKSILCNKFFCFTYPTHVPLDILKKVYYSIFESAGSDIKYWSVHYELGHDGVHNEICRNPHTHILIECDPRFRKRITDQLDVLITTPNGRTTVVSPLIDVYPNRKVFNIRKNITVDIQITQKRDLGGWTDTVYSFAMMKTGNRLRFIIENKRIMVHPGNWCNKFIYVDHNNFRVNLIGDSNGKLLHEFYKLEELSDNLDFLIIKGQTEDIIIDAIMNAVLKGWTGKCLVVGKYLHCNIYIVDTLGKAFGNLMFQGYQVPDVKSIWIFSATGIDMMVDDQDDGHYPYNIYEVNLEMNRLVQMSI